MEAVIQTDPNFKNRIRGYLIIVSAVVLVLGTLIGFLVKWTNGLSFKCTDPKLCNESQKLIEP